MDYQPRLVDEELTRQLRSTGAVVLEGPKAVGKTETASRQAASTVRLDLDVRARQAASVDPSLILSGETPRLIDEWQVVPGVWNGVRHEVDRRGLPGQFILTGSAVPADDDARHSGAGRIVRVRMRPMSLFETGNSTGRVSLAGLFDGEEPAGQSELPIPRIAELICRGGWPLVHALPAADAQQALRNYLTEIVHTDIRRVDGTFRDPQRVERVVRSLARNVSTMAALSVIAADTAGDDEPVARKTVPDYLSALERLMVVEDQPAWTPRLRSRSQLRVGPKRHFADPCLAAAALGATPAMLIDDLNTLGFLFESLVVRDLRVYSQRLGGRVLHYRDNTGLEVDVVVQLYDGRWAGLEVKLGGEKPIEDAAISLRRLADRVDQGTSGRLAFVGVITSGGYAYRREDGVLLLPVGCLGP